MLVLLSAVFWVPLVWSIRNMDQPLVQLMMPMTAAWSVGEAAAVWTMWAVMMGAMMLPSAIPMVLAHRRIAGQKGLRGDSVLFVGGYLAVWSVFSIAATGLQWALQGSGHLTRMLAIDTTWIAGIILFLAGASQWTPLKHVCLNTCRTPIGFFATEWRDGPYGAFCMGLHHGAFCVGCCWALMALLFVFGVMNLLAIGVLACLVAAEKLLPRGETIAHIGGIVLMIWGAWLILE
ncbi:MAG: DUF2182 domain-containing protein [Rhodobacteraceae bacterium]|nr:DUF2182 domain-containing protein [Paracoccaceae bacterium]